MKAPVKDLLLNSHMYYKPHVNMPKHRDKTLRNV